MRNAVLHSLFINIFNYIYIYIDRERSQLANPNALPFREQDKSRGGTSLGLESRRAERQKQNVLAHHLKNAGALVCRLPVVNRVERVGDPHCRDSSCSRVGLAPLHIAVVDIGVVLLERLFVWWKNSLSGYNVNQSRQAARCHLPGSVLGCQSGHSAVF